MTTWEQYPSCIDNDRTARTGYTASDDGQSRPVAPIGRRNSASYARGVRSTGYLVIAGMRGAENASAAAARHSRQATIAWPCDHRLSILHNTAARQSSCELTAILVAEEFVNASQSLFMMNQTNLCAHLRSRFHRNFGKIDSRIERMICY